MNRKIQLIAMILALVMLLAAFSGCGNNNVDETTGGSQNEQPSEHPSETPSEQPTESSPVGGEEESSEPTDDDVVENPHSDLINLTNSLANGVQGAYTSKLWKEYDITNQNMSLRYVLTRGDEQRVAHIKNTHGASYIENTMDVFVRMTDGYKVYASASSDDTLLNIYRFGYYYNDFRFQEQNFLDNLEVISETKVDITKQTYLSNMSKPVTNEDGSITFQIKAPGDPFIIFSEKLNIDTNQYRYVRVTMKTTEVEQASIYYIAGSQTKFNSNQIASFNLIPDGEYHTYYIKLFDEGSDAGTLKGLRIDLDSFAEIRKDISISEISFVEAEQKGIPDIELENTFHTYSDKLHQEIHIATYNELTGVAEIGIETIIAADTVSKIIVKDKNGTHDTLDGIDWASVECVGFDITEAGIFGYILPVHETTGNISVTLENGNYVIVYSRTPENNTLTAVEGNPDSKPGTVVGNDNDFRMGQRIYTDESHSFDELLLQTEIERNPLGGKNIKVSTGYSSNASFLGYDAIRGCYRFWIGYNNATRYYENRYFNIQVTFKSDDYKRVIYMMAENDHGGSPHVVLLDENLMPLPVPVEIGNNFVGDKDDTLFDVLDKLYQEATVPIIAPTDKTVTYNMVMSYYEWGNAEIKQLSSIQFHAPYYRVVTGATETNCIVPWKYTRTPAVPNRLPDHRAISAPEWPGTIDHTQGGSHSFGNKDATDLTEQTIISYGPSYSDLEMVYAGKDYKVVYHHIEMPQRDENRAYYTIDYTFKKTTTINKDFSVYSVGSFESTEDYKQFGYLDANNVSQIVKFEDLEENAVYIPLGDMPYIDAFELNHVTVDSYCNVACLVSDYEIVINGEKVDVGLLLKATKNNGSISLNFDIDSLTFNEGDTISINIILIPWGSEQTDYSDKDYPIDQNIRDVREDSLVNKIKLVAGEDCELIEHDWVPMGKTTNGKNATFTITGGAVSQYTIPNRDTGWRAADGHKMAVRIYGFKELGVPVVEQLVNGEWVAYELSSANNRDSGGHGAYFDGYGVYYDEDGTYSYTFVVDVNDAKDKTYRISLREDFEKFGWIMVDDSSLVVESPFNVYLDSNKFARQTYKGWFGRITPTDEGGTSYISYNPLPEGHRYNESQAEIYTNNDGTVTGQYIVIKYRLPVENANNDQMKFELFTSTVHDRNSISNPSDRIDASVADGRLIADGQWHVLVLDIATLGGWSMVPNENGEYKIQYIRLDLFNGLMSPKDEFVDRLDIADFAIHDNLEDIKEFYSDIEYITLITGSGIAHVSPSDETDIPVNPDPEDPTESDNEDLATESDASFNVFHNSNEYKAIAGTSWYSKVETGTENGVNYTSFYASTTHGESLVEGILKGHTGETGQYVIIKYRLPSPNPANVTLEFYTSTVNTKAVHGDHFTMSRAIAPDDGEWHVLIVDVASFGKSTIIPNEDGTYTLKHIRFDAINGTQDTSYRIDIAYFGVHDNLEEILDYTESCEEESVILYSAGSATPIVGEIAWDGSMKLYHDSDKFASLVSAGWVDRVEKNEENGLKFASVYASTTQGESQLDKMLKGNIMETGQYVVIKYRIPKMYEDQSVTLEFFTSTVNESAKGSDNFTFNNDIVPADNEWHVIVVDTTTFGKGSLIAPNSDGKYILKYLRFDAINGTKDNSYRIDIAYLAIHNDLDQILDFVSDSGDNEIIYISGGKGESMSTAK
ncbi:MAG: hypothetical protein IKA62_06990 [Clostridia bacterium]|nr:hypothetical protein [Clostridia bacterium]